MPDQDQNDNVTLDPRERRLRALELLQADNGTTKETLMKECGVPNQAAFSRLLRELKMGDHYAVQTKEGVYKALSFEEYVAWTKKDEKKVKTKTKVLKDLQSKRQKHYNTLQAKYNMLAKAQLKIEKDPNDHLYQVDLSLAHLNVERAELLFNRWSATTATDLGLDLVSELNEIVDLDQFVVDMKEDADAVEEEAA